MARPSTPTGVPMSTTIVQTPNVARIRELMDHALNRPDPMEFRFTIGRFGSLASAKSRAVSLQNQFNSIRARTRNSVHAQLGRRNVEDNGEQIKGPYDDLACNKHVLPQGEGYVVLIGRAPPDDFEIYDSVTKERILNVDSRTRRLDQLLSYWTERLFNKAVQPPYFTYEQEREMYDLDAEMFRNLFIASGLSLPKWLTGLDNLANEDDAPDFDLVDTPMNDFGVGPEGE